MNKVMYQVAKLQISVPRPSFLREQIVCSRASSCSMTRAPTGTLSCVCGLYLTPVARAVAIESCLNKLYFAGYRSRTTTACPRHLEALEIVTSSGGVLYSRRCSALVVDVLISSYCRRERCCCYCMDQHTTPLKQTLCDIQHDYFLSWAPDQVQCISI